MHLRKSMLKARNFLIGLRGLTALMVDHGLTFLTTLVDCQHLLLGWTLSQGIVHLNF